MELRQGTVQYVLYHLALPIDKVKRQESVIFGWKTSKWLPVVDRRGVSAGGTSMHRRMISDADNYIVRLCSVVGIH